MRRGTWALVGAVVAAVAVAVVVAGMALGGDEGTATKEEYQAVVVNTRDRTDFALSRFSKAQTPDELLERMDEAAVTIDRAAEDLSDTAVPPGLEDENEKLVRHLETLSADIQATADQARVPGYEQFILGGAGLDFESWPKVNAVFVELGEEGVTVPALERHKAASS